MSKLPTLEDAEKEYMAAVLKMKRAQSGNYLRFGAFMVLIGIMVCVILVVVDMAGNVKL